jgi:prevent-host-death family protein
MTWFTDNPLERMMQQKPLPIWRNREMITPSGGQRPFGGEIMLNTLPVSDLRNKFTEIEEVVKRREVVYLTKNGYGSMVVLSPEQYSALTESIELKPVEADKQAAKRPVRHSPQEVFSCAKERIPR